MVDVIRPIGDQAAGSDKGAFEVYRRQFVPGRKLDDQLVMNWGMEVCGYLASTSLTESPSMRQDLKAKRVEFSRNSARVGSLGPKMLAAGTANAVADHKSPANSEPKSRSRPDVRRFDDSRIGAWRLRLPGFNVANGVAIDEAGPQGQAS